MASPKETELFSNKMIYYYYFFLTKNLNSLKNTLHWRQYTFKTFFKFISCIARRRFLLYFGNNRNTVSFHVSSPVMTLENSLSNFSNSPCKLEQAVKRPCFCFAVNSRGTNFAASLFASKFSLKRAVLNSESIQFSRQFRRSVVDHPRQFSRFFLYIIVGSGRHVYGRFTGGGQKENVKKTMKNYSVYKPVFDQQNFGQQSAKLFG